MKTRSYDPSVDSAILIGIGQAHSVSGPEGGDEPVGRLLLPDPEQRNGWREHYVKPASDKPNRRPFGFGRP